MLLCKLYLPSVYMKPQIVKERMLGNYVFLDESNSKYNLEQAPGSRQLFGYS